MTFLFTTTGCAIAACGRLIHLMPQNCHFRSQHWNYYKAVNDLFAQVTDANVTDLDRVWIQDFHWVTRRRCTSAGPHCRSGAILARPVSTRIVLSHLSVAARAARRHVRQRPDRIPHFRVRRSFYRKLRKNLRSGRGSRSTAGEFSRADGQGAGFSLGIPADYFAELAKSPRVQARAQRIKSALGSPIIILGVDRLDYTKGILERVEGFERFLELNPAYHKRVAFIQIAVPSRTKVEDYARLKRQLDEQVGRVVGRFSSEGWVPIRYLYTQFGAEELVSYYQAADVALLTPLRDGMNLVAKEYVAARNRDPGC